MRLEDMEQEFPQMPEEMRTMIEREVEKQVNTTSSIGFEKKKHMMKKSFVAALVATFALGTTVCAGALYQMHSRSVGKYAVKTKVEGPQEEATSDILSQIPSVKLELAYLPEGMIESEKGKYCYEDSMYRGGVSICLYRMDTGNNQFEMLDTQCLSREDITVGEHDGVYLLYNTLEDGTVSYNQRIYVAYPDIHYVMQMYIGSDMTKEEAIKIAEGVKLTPTDNTDVDIIMPWNWSEYLASSEDVQEQEETKQDSNTAVSIERMKNTHTIGECFSAQNMGVDTLDGLMITVSNVQISDDINVLDKAYMDEDFTKLLHEETDADGKLLPAKINYIKSGNGVDTLDKIVSTREVPQKLVYVTVEYTNNGTSDLSEVLFMGSLLKIAKEGNQMIMYHEQPGENDDWDVAQITGIAQWREMLYYDVHNGERSNNYISEIKAGETVTVHMGWIVPEEDLKYLYLNLDAFGGCFEFDSHALALGYVDIRQ